MLTFPALQEVFPSLDYGGEEIYDVDFDDSGEMVRRLFVSFLQEDEAN